jgi:hypothetical protein
VPLTGEALLPVLPSLMPRLDLPLHVLHMNERLGGSAWVASHGLTLFGSPRPSGADSPGGSHV